MLTATFYKFSKRKNSTKIPTSDLPNLAMQITINDANTSLLFPSLRVRFPANDVLHQYNYVYIPNFSRYYFIQDWAYNSDGTWTATCRVDVLASWKYYIRNSGGYVGRSSLKISWDLADPVYPPSNTFLSLNDWYPTGLSSNIANGSFIIGVISDKTPNIGAAKYYLISSSNLATLMQNMMSVSDPIWGNVDSFSSDVLKSFVNPMQFIVSCKWFPFTIATSGVSLEAISLWGWNTGAYGYPIPATYVTLPPNNNSDGWWHLMLRDLADLYPSAGINESDYPYLAPYATYSIISPWGTFDLDPAVMARIYQNGSGPSTRTLDYKIMVNLVSGSGTFVVSSNLSNAGIASGETERYEFFRGEIEIGLDIPLAQVSINYLSVAKSSLSAAGKSGNIMNWLFNPVGNFTDVASDVLDATAASISPSVQTSVSSTAAFTPLIERIEFQMIRHKTIPRSAQIAGNIYKKSVSTIEDAGLGTFIQMDISTFEAPCTEAEQNEVISFLKDGFYNE